MILFIMVDGGLMLLFVYAVVALSPPKKADDLIKKRSWDSN
jgi:hypothetical protein